MRGSRGVFTNSAAVDEVEILKTERTQSLRHFPWITGKLKKFAGLKCCRSLN